MKPRIFIGSSVEGLEIAYAIQENLKHHSEITIWSQGVFSLSSYSLESIISELNNSDFGIFVFSPDDILSIRNESSTAIRDNVLFELGLFIGKLGRDRSFIIVPEKSDLHIPTDLIGITLGKYECDRQDNNLIASTGAFCFQVQMCINKKGLLRMIDETITSNEGDTEDLVQESLEVNSENSKIKWQEFIVEGEYEKAVSQIGDLINQEKEEEEIRTLKAWKCICNYYLNVNIGKKEYDKLKLEYKDDPDLYIILARGMSWNEMFNEAIEIIGDAEKLLEDNPSAIVIKAECLFNAGKEQDAIELIEIAIAKGISTEEIYLKIVEFYEKTSDYEQTKKAIHKAYKNYISSENILLKYAEVMEKENNKVSMYLLDKLLGLNNHNSAYWGRLGNMLLVLGLNNSALQAYEKANELSQESESWILGNIGNIYCNRGFYQKGSTYFRKAIELDNNSEYAYNRLGSCHNQIEEEKNKIKKLKSEAIKYLTNL